MTWVLSEEDGFAKKFSDRENGFVEQFMCGLKYRVICKYRVEANLRPPQCYWYLFCALAV